MSKLPSAEELLAKFVNSFTDEKDLEIIRVYCNAVLEAAAEVATSEKIQQSGAAYRVKLLEEIAAEIRKLREEIK